MEFLQCSGWPVLCRSEANRQGPVINHQMEVSLVVVHLLFCVLVCGVHSTAAVVVIEHNEIFDSGLVLKCSDKELFPLTSGVSFQRNGMDISVDGGGTLSYPLTQENEGTFTCTHGGQTSDPITLAGILYCALPLDYVYIGA